MSMNILNRISSIKATFPGVKFRYFLLMLLIRHLRKFLIQSGCMDGHENLIFKKEKISTPQKTSEPQIVCVSGFGYSGSGAVEDLLSEYDGVTVLAESSTETIQGRSKEVDFEFDLLRDAHGVMAFERFLNSYFAMDGNVSIHDFVEYISSLYYGPVSIFGDFFIAETRKFLDKIINCKIPVENNLDGRLTRFGNRGVRLIWPELCESVGSDFYFVLKNLPITDFRLLAKAYIQAVVSNCDHNGILVLDQIVSDGSGDVPKYKEYFGHKVKIICIFRDPRDVFAVAKTRREGWMPFAVEDFAKWYVKITRGYYQAEDACLLKLRFEDMVCDYANTCRKIEVFLGLNSNNHKRPFTSFAPDVSIKNVGAYKSVISAEEESYLLSHLEPFCYCN